MESQITIDEALAVIGEFGWGQIWQYILVSSAWIPGAIQTLIPIFFLEDPVLKRWWKCENTKDSRCAAALAASPPDVCNLPRDTWNWTHRNRSVISEFELICGRSWQVQASNSFYFGGFLIGACFWGVLSDRLGRRRALFASVLASFLTGIGVGTSPSYWWYCSWRLALGLANSGIGIIVFCLALEPIGVSRRGAAGVLQGVFFTLGSMAAVFLAWLVRPWRLLSLSSSAPQGLFLLLWPVVRESPRWLLVAGRKGDATAALAAIAVANGKKLPEQPLVSLGNSVTVRVGVWDVLRNPRLRGRLLVMAYAWFTASIAYYGSAFGMRALSGNIYLNNLMLQSVELPAYCLSICLLDLVGRRPLFVWSLAECAVCTLACACISGWPQRILAVAGRVGIAIAFNLAYVWTNELFPTTVRSTALGLCSQIGHAGGVLAPAIVFLGTVTSSSWPFIIIGSATLLAALTTATLPETQGAATLETIDSLRAPSRPVSLEVRTGPGSQLRRWLQNCYNLLRNARVARGPWMQLPDHTEATN